MSDLGPRIRLKSVIVFFGNLWNLRLVYHLLFELELVFERDYQVNVIDIVQLSLHCLDFLFQGCCTTLLRLHCLVFSLLLRVALSVFVGKHLTFSLLLHANKLLLESLCQLIKFVTQTVVNLAQFLKCCINRQCVVLSLGLRTTARPEHIGFGAPHRRDTREGRVAADLAAE